MDSYVSSHWLLCELLYASHTSVSCSGLLYELKWTLCKLQWTPIWAPVVSYLSSSGLLCELQWSPMWAPVVSYVSSHGLLSELSWTPMWALMDSYVSHMCVHVHGSLLSVYYAWQYIEYHVKNKLEGKDRGVWQSGKGADRGARQSDLTYLSWKRSNFIYLIIVNLFRLIVSSLNVN